MLFVTLLFACYRYLLWLSLTYFPESDNASPLLAAQDMLHGNWMLRGWWLPSDSFWLTDIPLDAVGLALRGFTPLLMHEVPAVIYLGVLGIVAVAALSPFKPAHPIGPQIAGIATAAALIPLLFPSDVLGNYALRGPYHIATTGFVLGSFLIMQHAVVGRRGRVSIRLTAAAAAVLAAAVISDPLALWIGVVPAILASFVLVCRHPACWRRHAVVPVSVAMTGWLAAKIILRVLHVLRGFTPVAGQTASFVDFPRFGANISLFVQGILELFGANFFGLPLSMGTLPVLLRLGGCLAVMTAIGWAWRNARQHDDELSLLLAAGAIVIAAAFLFSAIPRGRGSVHYLIPLVILGCALLGRVARRVAVPMAGKRRLMVLAVGIPIMGLYAVAPIARLRHPEPALGITVSPAAKDWPSVNALGSWLKTRGLHAGYGAYSVAAITTVATRGAVIVRPATADVSDDVRPMQWYAQCTWYWDTAARFVVTKENQENLNLSTVTMTFGRPNVVQSVAGYTVFEWDQPIRFKPAALEAARTEWLSRRLTTIAARLGFMRRYIDAPC